MAKTPNAAQGARLRQARIQAGYSSARSAALSNNWKESSYRAHERGTRTIGLDDAERYARRFRALGAAVTARSILFGEEPAPATPATTAAGRFTVRVVPLLSWVSAGDLVDPDSQIPVEEVPLLGLAGLPGGDYFALKVIGDSMDRVSPEGAIVVVNRADRTLVPDAAYIFSHRGETTYKLWQPAPPHLAPYSTNPAHKPLFVRGRHDLEVIGRVRRSILDL